MSVLPVLLEEGWTAEKVEALEAPGVASAILILNAPQEGQSNQFAETGM